MKKILSVTILLLLFSCGSTWDSDAGEGYKNGFLESCEYSPEVCNCILNKMMNKYSGPFDNLAGQTLDAATFYNECR